MTIYEIKRMVQQNEPFYFSSKTMKSFGQTLKDFKVKKMADGRYFISAPIKMRGKNTGYFSERFFNPNTNKLEFN